MDSDDDEGDLRDDGGEQQAYDEGEYSSSRLADSGGDGVCPVHERDHPDGCSDGDEERNYAYRNIAGTDLGDIGLFGRPLDEVVNGAPHTAGYRDECDKEIGPAGHGLSAEHVDESIGGRCEESAEDVQDKRHGEPGAYAFGEEEPHRRGLIEMGFEYAIEMQRGGVTDKRRCCNRQQAYCEGGPSCDVSEGVEEPVLKAALFSGLIDEDAFVHDMSPLVISPALSGAGWSFCRRSIISLSLLRIVG